MKLYRIEFKNADGTVHKGFRWCGSKKEVRNVIRNDESDTGLSYTVQPIDFDTSKIELIAFLNEHASAPLPAPVTP